MPITFDFSKGQEIITQSLMFNIRDMFEHENNKGITYWQPEKNYGVDTLYKIHYRSSDDAFLIEYFMLSKDTNMVVTYYQNGDKQRDTGKLYPLIDEIDKLKITSHFNNYFKLYTNI